MSLPPLQVCRLGCVPYRPTWELQARLAVARKRHVISDTLLVLEHEPVITFGRNTGRGSVLYSDDALSERGVSIVEVDRGGDATFHGQGQLIAYPIIDLRDDRPDIRHYVWRLEESMIGVMGEYGIQGGRVDDAPGAWVLASSPDELDRKMGALGVRLSRWVTHHGIALNINTDLSYFDLIIPCGLSGKGVTSLSREKAYLDHLDPLAFSLDFSEVSDHFIRHFTRHFPRRVIEVTSEALYSQLEQAERESIGVKASVTAEQ